MGNQRLGRVTWFMGACLPWLLIWVMLGLRFALLIGAHPHPFLPGMSYTGVMLSAVSSWALWALLSYASMGLLSSMLLLLSGLVIPGERPPVIGFKIGFLTGLASVLLVHGWLYFLVPGALGTLQGLRWLPMGLVILALLGSGVWIARLVLGGPEAARAWIRVSLGVGFIVLLLSVPHDVFRALTPGGNMVGADQPRLLVFSVDGMRQDVTEDVMPQWKAPGGCQPIVAIPATRLTWHMLLGAPPESYMNSTVIPYRMEWSEPPKTRLLDLAKQKGLSTEFIIDDSTTLSFGLSQDHFTDVLEPTGGWKHFFTVGFGTCWPVYSWSENYFSPVETTNPWSDVDAYLRDIGRGLTDHQWLSTHTCQLHAPFFLTRHEIQALRPWRWLWHSARSYVAYQSMDEAERDHFRRRDGRANPINHYKIRVRYLLGRLQNHMDGWVKEYPKLSGVLTADHGEDHLPVVDYSGNLVNFFTGIHGFTLDPASVRVPLHGFGLTESQFGAGDVFSWIDLRDCLERWIVAPEHPLTLRSGSLSGWVLQFSTVQATHVQKASRSRATSGAGIHPQELMKRAYLTESGFWFMDDPVAGSELKSMRKSYALVNRKGMTTLNPVDATRFLMIRYDLGYVPLEQRIVANADAYAMVKAFPGARLVPDFFPATAAEWKTATNP